MSLRSGLNGTFSLEQLDRLMFPVAWSATMPAAEARAEESELRDFVREAKEQLQSAYDASDSDTAEFSVKVENGDIIGIVEA